MSDSAYSGPDYADAPDCKKDDVEAVTQLSHVRHRFRFTKVTKPFSHGLYVFHLQTF